MEVSPQPHHGSGTSSSALPGPGHAAWRSPAEQVHSPDFSYITFSILLPCLMFANLIAFNPVKIMFCMPLVPATGSLIPCVSLSLTLVSWCGETRSDNSLLIMRVSKRENPLTPLTRNMWLHTKREIKRRVSNTL